MSRAELRRHARDSVSLVLGLLVLLAAGGFLVGDTTDLRLDGRWVAPVLLLGLGAAGLLASLRSRPDQDGSDQAGPDQAGPDQAGPGQHGEDEPEH